MKGLLVAIFIFIFAFVLCALILIAWASRTGDKKDELIRIVREKITDPEEVQKILTEYRYKDIIRYYEITENEHLMVEKVIYYNKGDNLNELTIKKEDVISIDYFKKI